MKRLPVLFVAVVLVAARFAPVASADRHVGWHQRIQAGPKMDITAATFFGAAGPEEFVGVAVAADGTIIACGNSWGPPFVEHTNTSVIGADNLWPVPLCPPGMEKDRQGRPCEPPETNPNRTGFLVFYAQHSLPKYCGGHLALENAKKRRPLILYGWGIENSLKMTFDYAEGAKERFSRKVEGAGTMGYNGYSCTVIGDWNDFAAAPLLLRQPRPILFVTFTNIADMKIEHKALQEFFKDDKQRIGVSLGQVKAIGPAKEKLPFLSFTAKSDVEIKAGPRAFVAPGVPIRASITRETGSWCMVIRADFAFEGTQLGFTGDDAGAISVSLSGSGWCVAPERFAIKPIAEQVKDELKKDPTEALHLKLE